MNNVDTIINLKVVACLKPFQRINTRGPLFQIKQCKYIPEFVQRWWEGSTRESDFGRIMDLYGNAMQDPALAVHLVSSLDGLAALKKTYEHDLTMVARIDTLVERVRGVVDDL